MPEDIEYDLTLTYMKHQAGLGASFFSSRRVIMEVESVKNGVNCSKFKHFS